MKNKFLAKISPEYASILESQDIGTQLEPEENDATLEGLASQTQQPYRPGWSALPGVASSIVGGLAAQKLNKIRSDRSSADDKVYRTLMGGGSPYQGTGAQNTTYTPPSATSQFKPAPIVKTVAPTPANTTSQIATPQQVAPTPAPQSPMLARVQYQQQQLQKAASMPMSASARMALMQRKEKLDDLQMRIEQGAYEDNQKRQDGSLVEQIRQRRAALADIGIDEKSSQGRSYLLTGKMPDEMSRQNPNSVREFQFARQNGFKGTYTDFLDRGKNKTTPSIDLIKQRRDHLKEAGVDPASQAGRRFLLTGQLSDNALSENTSDKSVVSNKIAGGLNRLAQVPNDYGADLDNAIGTIQGDDNAYLAPLARTWGAFLNSPAFGGRFSPTQIRTRIAGDTVALAATIKPLIRGPGEGAWTDADQARLESVVGNLSLANNEQEYMQALEGVRNRVMQNFGVELPPLNGQAQDGAGAPRQPTAPQASAQQANMPRPQSREEWNELPPGTQYIAPTGQIMVKK